ncbi:tyrosine-type recombinase/integrase [Thermopolyspora sp. NPDC052614]|uniref:tyrosine-type recombinase/integrase n=1 Tax=Thermopolyspora sp. NPDC052614 TaxID=3155682 RepID=UPI00341528C1
MAASLDLQFWAIRKRAGRKKPWELRWRVGTKQHSRSFLTKALAQTHQAKLTKAAKEVGEEWDPTTGEPVSWGRAHRSWFDHAVELVTTEWDQASANYRKILAGMLTDVTMTMVEDSARARRTRPDDKILRKALNLWAFRPGRADNEPVPEPIAQALTWAAAHTRPVADLADDEHLRAVLARLGKLQNGKQASAGTLTSRRAALYRALDLAVQRKLIRTNPLPAIKTKRRVRDEALSPVVVPTLDQARRLLAALPALTNRKPACEDRGKRLHAFFAIMYYAGLRPSEVTALCAADCTLPPTGWGKLTLRGACPYVGELWTDDGQRHDPRGLKHRADNAIRVVPIPPLLVAIIRDHIDTHGTADDGRLFWVEGPQRPPLPRYVYVATWNRARKAALTPQEYASPVARRPYDLRHANASMLLAAGVDSLQVARRLGHTIRVLLTVYAHWIDTGEDAANTKIEAIFDTPTLKAVTSENDPAGHGPPTGQHPQHPAA